MGDIDRGDAELALKLLDDGAHLNAQLGVEVRERLVHQQNARLDDKGAGQRNALLLTAGELVGLALGEVSDLHQLQRLLNAGTDLGLGDFTGLQTVGDVLFHGQMGENGVVLKDHADVTLVSGDRVDQPVSEIEFTALNGVEACDHAQKRSFTAAGRAQQREEFALFDVQRHALEGNEIPVLFDCVFDNDCVAHNDSSDCFLFSKLKETVDPGSFFQL